MALGKRTRDKEEVMAEKVESYPATTHTKRVLKYVATRRVVCHAFPITAGGGRIVAPILSRMQHLEDAGCGVADVAR